MFREPSEAERAADLAGVSSDAILLPGEEYAEFVRRRLAYWPIVEIEVAGVEPPTFPETLDYIDSAGMTVISEIHSFSEAVTDAGLDEWQHVMRRVAPSRHVELWRMANRLQDIANEALIDGSVWQRERDLAQSQEETTRLLRELEARDVDIVALEVTVAELRGRQD